MGRFSKISEQLFWHLNSCYQLYLSIQGEGGLLPHWRCLLNLLPPGCLGMDIDKENWCAKGVGTTISHLPFSTADETLAFILEGGQVGRPTRLTSLLLRPLYSLRQCQIMKFWVNQSSWEMSSSGTCCYSFPVPFQCLMKGEPVRRKE